jgi:hypothetical protein
MDVEEVDTSEVVPVRRDCGTAREHMDGSSMLPTVDRGVDVDATDALSAVDTDSGPLQWLRDGTRDGHRAIEGLRVLLCLLVFVGSALSRTFPTSATPFDAVLVRPATVVFTVVLGFGASVGIVTSPGPGAQRVAALHATFLPAFVVAVAVTLVTGTFNESWAPEGTSWIEVLLRFCGAATGLYTDFEGGGAGRQMWFHGVAQTLLVMLAVKPMATLRLVLRWTGRKTPQRALVVGILVVAACVGIPLLSGFDMPAPLARSVVVWLLPCALGALVGTSSRFVAVSTGARCLRGLIGVVCDAMAAGMGAAVYRSLVTGGCVGASLCEYPELAAPLAAAWVWCLANGAGITQWVLSRSAIARWAPATCAFYLLTDAAWALVMWALGRDALSAPPPPWVAGYAFAWNALVSFAMVSFAVPRWARLTLPVWEWALNATVLDETFNDPAVEDAGRVLTLVLSAVRDLSRTPRAMPSTRLDAIGLGSLELAGLAAVLNRRVPPFALCGGISVSALRHCESVADVADCVARSQQLPNA